MSTQTEVKEKESERQFGADSLNFRNIYLTLILF
jgi:hypothetical protein